MSFQGLVSVGKGFQGLGRTHSIWEFAIGTCRLLVSMNIFREITMFVNLSSDSKIFRRLIPQKSNSLQNSSSQKYKDLWNQLTKFPNDAPDYIHALLLLRCNTQNDYILKVFWRSPKKLTKCSYGCLTRLTYPIGTTDSQTDTDRAFHNDNSLS